MSEECFNTATVTVKDTAEFLNIEFYETMDTMLHEMIHLYCKVKGIQDTSRNGSYHNKRFKEECLKRGFYYPDPDPDSKIGWAYPKITEETKRIMDAFSINRSVFQIARKTFQSTPDRNESEENEGTGPRGSSRRKKTHIIKWVCPGCLAPVRSSKTVNIICGDCKEVFVEASV
ncbi:hypothetical protein GK047_17855 [Paenibacillus sp. SYP-B3998]|uniref:SprT-like domain-containing protein n=1 Tax=Paenibacillus sp. SYP-B3998 TaxID=2678564 RepID=A0A6G4A0P7_9BACL|nr:hypothetical protein [Paenibacillus sp. SYP-B3998]NEW07868.1 hypothetical protein [Paenibacillus sp. SYP-B3998]